MFLRNISKVLIPTIFAILGIEIGTIFIAYQPKSTTWRTINKNGLMANKENIKAIHEHWEGRKIKYSFGEYGNRISLDNSLNKKNKKNFSSSDSCRYLAIGDSMTFGWLVNYEKTFPFLIQKYLNEKFDKQIFFLNSGAGGWGYADYPAYLEIYKEKLQDLNLNGIIVFGNIDDARRASVSNLYSLIDNQKTISVKRSNNFYYSKVGQIKRFLDTKYISEIYNFSLQHFNTVRILKNYFLLGRIAIHPEKKSLTKENPYYPKESLKNNDISKEAQLKLQTSLIDLSKLSAEIAPLNLIQTGVLPINELSSVDQYLYSKKGIEFLESNNFAYDFTTFRKNRIYGSEGWIKFDGHPNALGHSKIAKNILSSNSENSLINFIKSTCN